MKTWLTTLAAAACIGSAFAQAPTTYANRHDQAVAGRYEQREADWRNGAIVYQVLVDRFAPSANLAAKRHLYPAPKTLRAWDEPPQRGSYLEREQVWSHEIDFWGGDLASVMARLDYVQGLGADVLYLNPIHHGWTNHKYDSLDFQTVSPEFGTREDVKKLAAELKRRGMKLVLDGVFNHMGRNAARFQQALADPASPWRDWFVFGPQYPGGVRIWWDAVNLPELNLEHPPVREHLYGGPDSVVRSYLRDGADGWRLDVAYDIGFRYLQELTDAAHAEKPGSLVVGEIPNFPREWLGPLDGVMQIQLYKLIHDAVTHRLTGPDFQRMADRLIRDADYEHVLKSWVLLDNHDSPRLATAVPDLQARRLAQVLQFTLPGSPNLYYGTEVGMEGGEDPAMRGPMRWDRVQAGHPELAWTRQLIALRKKHRALRVGDWRTLEAAGGVIAFERHTDRVGESVIVVVNPKGEAADASVMLANSKLMDRDSLIEQLTGRVVNVQFAMIQERIPAQTAWVLQPRPGWPSGYSNFKRVQ
jgi:cyclomaltodextrinase / maltogenic alpha-amylase / neopullulanase